jgi:hypothetical protein
MRWRTAFAAQPDEQHRFAISDVAGLLHAQRMFSFSAPMTKQAGAEPH